MSEETHTVTDDEIMELEALLKDISPGPWQAITEHKEAERYDEETIDGLSVCALDDPDLWIFFVGYREDLLPEDYANAEFICKARKYLPLLIEEVKKGRLVNESR